MQRSPGSAPAPAYRTRRLTLAVAVAAMGAINLASAIFSHPSDRLLAIRRLLPVEVLDTSRTFTLLAGGLLLITASGLRRGKRRAFVAALFLCAISVPVNLLKAFDFEEATTAAAMMFALGVSGEAFRVKSRAITLRSLGAGTLAAALGLAAYAVVGCWWIEARYGAGASWARAAAEAVYQLVGLGSHALSLPPGLPRRAYRVVTWYLGSVSVLGITIFAGAAAALLRPVQHRRRHGAEAERVAAILHAHGDATVSAFALDPDVDYFFSATGRAVIAYRFESGTLLTIGDPIGPAEELPGLLAAFAAHCREHDWQFAIFQARPERLPLYDRLGWSAVHIGEDPILRPARFTLEGPAMADARRAVRRLEGRGVGARMFRPGDAAFDPARDPDGLYEQMRAISNDWVRARKGGEKGFCIGRFDHPKLSDVWLAVAWNPAARRVEAFVTWVPIWARHGWALDLMRRRADAPTGVMEFLVVKSVEAAAAAGDAMLSLSLSALASVEAPALAAGGRDGEDPGGDAAVEPGGPVPGPGPRRPFARIGASASDRTREFLIEHLARFYDFQGLLRWKRKFDPAFEDRFLVIPEPLALPRVALALVRAQSPEGLLGYFRS